MAERRQTSRMQTVLEELEVLAIKEPFLRPVCNRLRELIMQGQTESYTAQRLLEYVMRELPSAESEFWRALLAKQTLAGDCRVVRW